MPLPGQGGIRITAKLLKAAKSIFQSALKAGDPYGGMRNHLSVKKNRLFLKPSKYYNLDDYKRVIVVGAGKATARMALALEDIFENLRIPLQGLISVKYGYTATLKHIKITEAGHPYPDINGVQAARSILNILSDTDKDDLVVSLISGGGSSLLPLPVSGITLDHKMKITKSLLACGAGIREINSVRKHISLTKGGQLASAANPSLVINLPYSLREIEVR